MEKNGKMLECEGGKNDGTHPAQTSDFKDEEIETKNAKQLSKITDLDIWAAVKKPHLWLQKPYISP